MSRVVAMAEDRSARKRRVVVEAATTLFLRHGYLGTSMDQIAAFAAVSKPTVYKFFPDKEQLFTAIVLETLDRAGAPFLAELSRLVETRSGQLADDLRDLARRYIATVTQPAWSECAVTLSIVTTMPLTSGEGASTRATASVPLPELDAPHAARAIAPAASSGRRRRADI